MRNMLIQSILIKRSMIRSLRRMMIRKVRSGKTIKRRKMSLLKSSQLCQQTGMPSVILRSISCTSSSLSFLQPSAYFMFTSRQILKDKDLKKIKGLLMKKEQLTSLIFLLVRVLMLSKYLETTMKRKSSAWRISRKEFLTVKVIPWLKIMQVFINIENLELLIAYYSICI